MFCVKDVLKSGRYTMVEIPKSEVPARAVRFSTPRFSEVFL